MKSACLAEALAKAEDVIHLLRPDPLPAQSHRLENENDYEEEPERLIGRSLLLCTRR